MKSRSSLGHESREYSWRTGRIWERSSGARDARCRCCVHTDASLHHMQQPLLARLLAEHAQQQPYGGVKVMERYNTASVRPAPWSVQPLPITASSASPCTIVSKGLGADHERRTDSLVSPAPYTAHRRCDSIGDSVKIAAESLADQPRPPRLSNRVTCLFGRVPSGALPSQSTIQSPHHLDDARADRWLYITHTPHPDVPRSPLSSQTALDTSLPTIPQHV